MFDLMLSYLLNHIIDIFGDFIQKLFAKVFVFIHSNALLFETSYVFLGPDFT